MTGLGSSNNANVSTAADSSHPRVQQLTEVAPPSTESEFSTISSLQSKKPLTRLSITPQLSSELSQRGKDEKSTSATRQTPSNSALPKVAGREVDRFVDCPVIVRHPQLGWLEIQCNLCGGNSQPSSGVFILGFRECGVTWLTNTRKHRPAPVISTPITS